MAKRKGHKTARDANAADNKAAEADKEAIEFALSNTWPGPGHSVRAAETFRDLESARNVALNELECAQEAYDRINDRYQAALSARTLRDQADRALSVYKEALAKAKELEEVAKCQIN
jgi:hypothetical protein